MRLVTRRQLAATVADRWQEHCCGDDSRYLGAIPGTLARLRALGPNPNPDDVVAAAPGLCGGWVDLHCDECGNERIEEAIEFGGFGGYLCLSCVEKAASLFRASER